MFVCELRILAFFYLSIAGPQSLRFDAGNIMHHPITVDAQVSFLVSLLVLFTGYFINRHVTFLKRHSIPTPIVGGLIASGLVTVLHYSGISLVFDLPYQNTFMLLFFASLGLSANWTQLRLGGVKVAYFMGIATIFIIGQNAVGVQLSRFLGIDPLFGLVAGSITLSGGHGTGAAWAPILETNYGLSNAMEVAMACATFGLIAGGLIGGPIAQRLIKKHDLVATINVNPRHRIPSSKAQLIKKASLFEHITPNSITHTLFSLFICVVGALALDEWVHESNLIDAIIPNFVYALILGVLIANASVSNKLCRLHHSMVTFVGDISLKLFLAMALLNLQLWDLVDLALPILVILLIQTVFQTVFACWVTFRAMGKDYDAAVMASGHCGFGMGSTATAVMNMNAIVSRFSPSPQAFIVVPIVGAFFIDIINLLTLQMYLSFVS